MGLVLSGIQQKESRQSRSLTRTKTDKTQPITKRSLESGLRFCDSRGADSDHELKSYGKASASLKSSNTEFR